MLVIPNNIAVIRGAGDLASGIAHRLHRSGFRVLMLEVGKPLVIRRKVSYAAAIYNGEIEVEGVKAVKADTLEQIKSTWKKNNIAVLIDPEATIVPIVKPGILVDAVMAKKNIGTTRDMAPITIGIGPGFNAGTDVDVVIESQRGHYLGRLILEGFAEPDTGIPAEVMGYGRERVLRAPAEGIINNLADIGDEVKKGQVICYIDNVPVFANIDGVLRGLIADGIYVGRGLKIGDIDPRADKDYCNTISEKARAIGGSVLEAIFLLRHQLS